MCCRLQVVTALVSVGSSHGQQVGMLHSKLARCWRRLVPCMFAMQHSQLSSSAALQKVQHLLVQIPPCLCLFSTACDCPALKCPSDNCLGPTMPLAAAKARTTATISVVPLLQLAQVCVNSSTYWGTVCLERRALQPVQYGLDRDAK